MFTVEVNDGARLWIGDQLMFNNFDDVRHRVFSLPVQSLSNFLSAPVQRRKWHEGGFMLHIVQI